MRSLREFTAFFILFSGLVSESVVVERKLAQSVGISESGWVFWDKCHIKSILTLSQEVTKL
jgi:hypothetical protein